MLSNGGEGCYLRDRSAYILAGTKLHCLVTVGEGLPEPLSTAEQLVRLEPATSRSRRSNHYTAEPRWFCILRTGNIGQAAAAGADVQIMSAVVYIRTMQWYPGRSWHQRQSMLSGSIVRRHSTVSRSCFSASVTLHSRAFRNRSSLRAQPIETSFI